MLKYFLILNVLLRLTSFDAIGAIEKTIFSKIIYKIKKEQSTKTINFYTILL